ncbi:MAG: FeoB-associated Cys-rich membrane protein [Bacteroidales bacterium]
MIQSILTYLIVCIAFIIVSIRIYKAFTSGGSDKSPCGGCSGCDLKNEILKNKKAKAEKCNDHKDSENV